MSTLQSSSDLQRFIDEHDINARLIADIGDTPTVSAAADALGVAPEHIVKTLLFLVEALGQDAKDPQPVVIISNGESRVEKRPVADHFLVGRKRIKLAPPAVVAGELGYPVGGVPPIGHRHAHPVLLDQTIVELGGTTTIYAGGGDDRTMLAMTVDELIRLVEPVAVLPLSNDT